MNEISATTTACATFFLKKKCVCRSVVPIFKYRNVQCTSTFVSRLLARNSFSSVFVPVHIIMIIIIIIIKNSCNTVFPRDIVCLRNMSINTPRKGDDDDDDDNDNNNNNNNNREDSKI